MSICNQGAFRHTHPQEAPRAQRRHDQLNTDKQGPGWVSVFNRNRDGYQVPLALEEDGMLAFHVADFYASPRIDRWLAGPLERLKRLRHPRLGRERVRTAPSSFLLQMLGMVLRVPMRRVFPITDFLLGLRGAAVARKTGANLLCYGNYVPPGWAIPSGATVILFEYHPLASYTYEILKEDARAYPHVAQSFAAEERDLQRDIVQTAWMRADRIICASGMTRRSLVHAGCPEDRIAVVPYGCSKPVHPVTEREDGPCRFLFVGQGIQRKGLHHLLEAWDHMAPFDAELTVVCYHIDPGIKAAALKRNITLLGRQSREDLDRLLHAADAFVMPSLVEGFGLAYLEALSAGCHAIGTPNTGLPDLPFGEDMVTIVPVGDTDALARAMISLVQRKQERRLSAVGISQGTAKWQWADFRRGLTREVRRAEADAAPGGRRPRRRGDD